MDNPSMDKLDRPAYRPGIKTSKCCQAIARLQCEEEGCYYICTACKERCEVWHNDMRF
jgi:hypothetical protein